MRKKSWIIAGLCALMMLSSLNVFAWDRDRGDRHHGERFHYRNGHWYRRGWFGIDIVAPALPIGAVVEALPYGYVTVTVGGVPYYRYEGSYYRHYPEGYMVVPAPEPVVVVQEQKMTTVGLAVPRVNKSDVVVINVPNVRGGYTPVKLIKHKGGYIGPQGEYYEHPTVKQLKVLYGK